MNRMRARCARKDCPSSSPDRALWSREVPHFKLTVAYDGTAFVGWQRQASGTSIQELLENGCALLDGRPVAVTGAGRTDAGVHAFAQVAHVSLERDIDAATVVRALNNHLPPAVRVLDAAEVSATFHARFNATAKRYRYRIWNQPVLSPFEREYTWHIPGPILDVEAMAAAAARLEGRHDFAAFQTAGAETHTTERVVFSSRITTERPLILYDVRGDGFLRHMVRSIVGTLVEVGRGRYPAEWITEVLESTDRARGGRTAPAAGLFLMSVEYEPPDL
jgi:tRNA pseudouridine38-40 synthase